MPDFRHIVTTEEDGEEVRVLMRRHFDLSSRLRGRIKREHRLHLNGVPAEGFHRAKAGDVVSIDMPEERSHFPAEDIPVYPVFEDDDMLLLNKQPYVTVHPTKGHTRGTIANGLMTHMEKTGKPFKVRFVNRLDMDTSGLLIVAKNAYVQNDLMRQMKRGNLSKEYIALVCGIISGSSGTIDLPIGHSDPTSPCRDVCEDGAPSVTHYEVMERFFCAGAASGSDMGYTLVRLKLETGRTHQIRVHMSYIGHPVVSDILYGTPCPELIGRQALHAAALRFTHPGTKKELHIEAPIPDDMQQAIQRLREQG